MQFAEMTLKLALTACPLRCSKRTTPSLAILSGHMHAPSLQRASYANLRIN
jgi:hypothetical protein